MNWRLGWASDRYISCQSFFIVDLHSVCSPHALQCSAPQEWDMFAPEPTCAATPELGGFAGTSPSGGARSLAARSHLAAMLSSVIDTEQCINRQWGSASLLCCEVRAAGAHSVGPNDFWLGDLQSRILRSCLNAAKDHSRLVLVQRDVCVPATEQWGCVDTIRSTYLSQMLAKECDAPAQRHCPASENYSSVVMAARPVAMVTFVRCDHD